MKRRRILLYCIFIVTAMMVRLPAAYGHGQPSRPCSDLDGGHRTDVIVSIVKGSTIRIKIKLSGDQSSIRLKSEIENEPGLQLVSYDVNNDNQADLVLTSIFTPHPVAVWINNAHGQFDKTTDWIAALPSHDDSGQYRRNGSEFRDEAVPGIGDSLPLLHAEPELNHRICIYPYASRERILIPPSRWESASSERGPPFA